MNTRRITAVMGLSGLGLLAYQRQIVSFLLRLPAPQFSVDVELNIPIPMADGIRLMADRYYPSTKGSYPTILIRSYYGRGGAINRFIAGRFAERGYQVLIQATRGREDSEGDPSPLVNEAADGKATLAWVAHQPWFNGSLGMWGQSYLGYVQWAVAADAPPYLKALCPSTTSSQFHTLIYPDGALGLDTMMCWILNTNTKELNEGKPFFQRLLEVRPDSLASRLEPAFSHLPVGDADRIALGAPDPYYQDLIAHPDKNHHRWKEIDHSRKLNRVTLPVSLVSGWYDVLLRELLEDYLALRKFGQQPRLTIGPWSHIDFSLILEALRDGLVCFDIHLKENPCSETELPIRIFVMGINEWRYLPDWPPPTAYRRYFLSSPSTLSDKPPRESEAESQYWYNPAHPTPALAGPRLLPPTGMVDNRSLESRPDVLVFSSNPLTDNLTVIGAVRMDLFARSDLAHTDFYARLCDVQPDGTSLNVCDGLVRLSPGDGALQRDGSLRIQVDMWSTAYVFQPDHRVRILIASGAHPRWNRNLGTGEPLATGRAMRVAHQTIFHDRHHPSAIVLPVPR